jgi:hypothetical protein
MTESKRRFWRIHLSTAIMLMFVMAVVLGLNFSRIKSPTSPERFYGWPMFLCVYGENSAFSYLQFRDSVDGTPFMPWEELRVLNFALFVLCDVAVCAALLIIVAMPCEYLIRRREIRRTPQESQ